jgi:hypothetical protein
MAYENIEAVQKALASCSEAAGAGKAVATVTVRDEYTRSNYDRCRPAEQLPTSDRDIIVSCNNAYYTVGIVRNMVDLMADFCVKGINWEHTNRNIQTFYRQWFSKINGYDVSERFCNYLARLGNNCVYTNYMKVPDIVAQEWKKTKGEEFKNVIASNRKIPSQYVFIDITSLSELYPELGKFTNKRTFIMSFANGLINSMNYGLGMNRKTHGQFDIANVIKYIPDELRKKISENNGNMVFNTDELKISHYKKDDWDSWAKPLIYSILEPLTLLKKMHLADMSALDGAISNIRLWKVGYIDPTNPLNSVIPTKSQLAKVREVVLNNITAGTLDVFWGPDLDFKESNTEVHKFLGPEKYSHVMAMIYDGMGIPPSLAGGAGGGESGFTNNFISMKVLIEKLNYLRNKLTEFWACEAKIVQKAMGFSSPAKLIFDDAILSDEAQYKKLLLELYDRDIISLESVREEFNLIDPIEASRITRETKHRAKDKIPQKAGAFHDPMWKILLEANMMKEGVLDPTIYGIEVDQRDIINLKAPKAPNGRPTGVKDQIKRKPKIVRPRTTAESVIETQVWAKESIDKISDIITPAYVASKEKAYARDLTNSEVDDLENIKLGILGAHNSFSEITEDSVIKACADLMDTSELKVVRDTLLERFNEKFKRKPTIEDRRIAAAAAYSIIKSCE